MPEPPNHALKSSSAFVWNTGQRGTPMYTVGSTSWSLKPPVLSPTWQRTRGDWPRPLVQSRPWYYCWCPPRPRLPSWSRCRHPQCLASSPWWRFSIQWCFTAQKVLNTTINRYIVGYIIISYYIQFVSIDSLSSSNQFLGKLPLNFLGKSGVSHPPSNYRAIFLASRKASPGW